MFFHGDLDEPATFHHIVDHEIADSQFQCFFDLFIALVVAVEVDLAHVHARPAHTVKLTAADRVKPQPLRCKQFEQCDG